MKRKITKIKWECQIIGKVSYFWAKLPKMRITVIGEANIDISVFPQGNAHQGGCTPARISFHHGGVARNIAHNLKLLGHEVRLMTVFGGDAFAERLISDCKNIGLDLSLSTVYEQEKSPIFLSFNDEIGNMQSAASDIKLNDRMDLDWLMPKMDEINRSNMVVADTLLTADALAHLMDHCTVPLFLDSVSPVRALRIAEALKKSERHALFALKCNTAEAVTLTGETDPTLSSKQLNAKGIKNVYLTLGPAGVIHCTEGIVSTFPALPAKVVNVTGSGDAFFAGVIHAYTQGVIGNETVCLGLVSARENLGFDGPVANFSG